MIDEDYSGVGESSSKRNVFIGRSCLRRGMIGRRGREEEVAAKEKWRRGGVAVIVIIFSGGRIYATHLVVSVHKTHLKFSRQAGKVAAVLVDGAG